MQSFSDWAKVYDKISEGYKEDVKFYNREARKAKGKILEIGCGTGRIYLDLLKASMDVYGIDISKEMLNVLKEKAKKEGLKPKVYLKDMKNFKLKEKFSLVIVPFRSFVHNLTIQDQVKTLKNIRRHLVPKGKLILSFRFPSTDIILHKYGKTHKQNIKTNEGIIKVITEPVLINQITQIIELKKSFYRKNKLIYKDHIKMALIYKREFELLLRLSGFRKWKVYGNFNYEKFKKTNQEVVWIIQK